MATSSSAKKVAKLAQKGKGKKVRFQGGTLFPLVVAGVVILFGALIVWARYTRPGPGEGEPTSNQHWHAALGFYVCDSKGLKIEPNLTGILEDTDASGKLTNERYIRTGIHSHGDGVMHWHPSASGVATGTNAKLKVFLANYGVSLTNTKLSFPANQGGETFEEGKTTCKVDGVEKKASLKLWVWDNYANSSTADPSVYTTNMGDVRIKKDGMVFMIAFVPDGTKPIPPESAANLKALGAADGGGNGLPSTADTTGSNPVVLQSTTTVATSGSTPTSAVGEPSATSTSAKSSTATTAATATTGG